MTKDNRKTIRLSASIMDYIQSQPGDSFTYKLESLIWKYKYEIPIREEEIERLERKIADANNALNEIQKIQSELHALADHIKNFADNLLSN